MLRVVDSLSLYEFVSAIGLFYIYYIHTYNIYLHFGNCNIIKVIVLFSVVQTIYSYMHLDEVYYCITVFSYWCVFYC